MPDDPTPNPSTPPRWMGYLHGAAGSVICLVALGLIPIDETKLHAPRWVLFLCGLLFLTGGTLVLTYGRRGMLNACAAVIAACLGTVAGWVALYGDAAQFHGNLPLDHASQVSTARIAFGLGGIACYAMMMMLIARMFRGGDSN